MAVKFSPNGFLDIASDPSELPSEVEGKNEISGAMRRCTNLQLNKAGIASTRDGSSKVNSSAMDQTTAYTIIELGGLRHVFAGTKIYQDETAIGTGMFTEKWSGIKTNPYNSNAVSVFALNGTDRKRIDGNTVYEWGMDAPDEVPALLAAAELTGLTGDYNAKYTHVRKEGDLVLSESDPSDAAAAAVTLADQGLRVICHHNVDDNQMTHLRVYRTLTGGAAYYKDQDIPMAPYASYGYTYDWEFDDEYISGDGYCITEEITTSTYYTKERYYDDGINAAYLGYNYERLYFMQGFKPDSTFDLAAAAIYLRKIGVPADDITVSIYTTWTGHGSRPDPDGLLVSGTLLKSQVETSWAWKTIIFPDEVSLTADTLYWLVINVTTPNLYNYYQVLGYFTNGSNQFGDANEERFVWGQTIGGDVNTENLYDMDFRAYSYASASNRTIFEWEADTTTETNQYAAKNCFNWEPGFLVTNTADTALGTEVATDHDRPPLGNFAFGPSFNGTCFILIDNLLHYCLPKEPEHWPLTYYVEVGPANKELISGLIYDGQIYVASEDQIYHIPGTGHSSFGFPLEMSAITGTVSAQCFLAIHGQGIFHLGNDGLYLHSGTKDENITNARFKPIFEGDTVGSIPGIDQDNIANCWMLPFQGKIYFAYPESGSTYPDNFIVTDLATGKSVHYDYNGTAFPCACIDEQNNRILAVDTSGYVWELEDPDVTTDDETAISWQIETKQFTDQLRKYFPRAARYDVTLNNGATATGYVLLDGTSIQSHTLSTSRATKKRLVDGKNGDRMALRITGSGPVDIYAAEVE